MVESVQGPPPCKTYDPVKQLNGDFGGFQVSRSLTPFVSPSHPVPPRFPSFSISPVCVSRQVRQFTEGEYELATAVPGFRDIANAPLVETAAEMETQATARL